VRRVSQIVPSKEAPRWLYEILRKLETLTDQTQASFGAISRGEIPDGTGTPIVRDDIYLKLRGRPDGQTAHGAIESAGKLTLVSTTHDVKGKIYFGTAETSTFDEALVRLGVGTASPQSTLQVVGGQGVGTILPSSDGPAESFTWGKYDLGGGPTPGTFTECVLSNDQKVAARHEAGSGGAYGFKVVLDSPISRAGTYTLWYSVSRLYGALPANTTIIIDLFASDGYSFPSPLIIDATALAQDVYTRGSVTFSGAQASSGTANSIRVSTSIPLFSNNHYVAVNFLAVTEGAAALGSAPVALFDGAAGTATLSEWRQYGETTRSFVDAAGRFGIGTSASLSRMLTVVAEAAAAVPVAVIGAAAQTANLQDWLSSTPTVLASVTKDGYFSTRQLLLVGSTSGTLTVKPAAATISHTLTLPSAQGLVGTFLKNDGAGVLSWAAATNTLLDNANHTDTVAAAAVQGALILGNAIPKWDRLTIGAAGSVLASNGTTAAWTATSGLAIPESAITDGAILARREADETISGIYTFNMANADGDGRSVVFGIPNAGMLTFQAETSTGYWGQIEWGTTGLFTYLTTATPAFGVLVFPSNGELMATDTAQTVQAKTFQNQCKFDFHSTLSVSGCIFRDKVDPTKITRLDLTGIATGTTRTQKFQNLNLTFVGVGNDPPAVAAGSLGKVDLTAQGADISTTNLSNTPPVGVYEIEVIVVCTAVDAGAGTLTVTVGWTDVGGARTDTSVTRDLTATGQNSGRVLMQVNSGNITYATAASGIYGPARYAIYIRVVALG